MFIKYSLHNVSEIYSKAVPTHEIAFNISEIHIHHNWYVNCNSDM